MKRFYLFMMVVLCIGLPGILRSQSLSITEINYNDPSGGNFGDTLEFIEIYNILSTPIDLTGYKLTSGVTFTFPTTVITGGGYVIVAKNAVAVDNFFNITGTLQWDANQGLTNTNGEALVLKDSTGLVMDSVRYYVAAPWPTSANGLGASLMRCDPMSQPHMPSSWVAADISTALMYGTINNYTVFATPLAPCLIAPVYSPVYAVLPFYESFDSTWINGDNYRDVPSYNWSNNPAIGNNSWRRNDDGYSAYWNNINNGGYTPTGSNGTSYSARFHTAASTTGLTGALQLYLDFHTVGNKKLKFWYINTSGTDSLAVYFSEDGGTTYSFLDKYTNTVSWEEKQIMLGTGMSPTCIIKFVATSNNTANDIGIDQVRVFCAPDNDAGITGITSPPNSAFTANHDIKVSLTNFGNLDLTAVNINWTVDNGPISTFPWTGVLASGNSLAEINLSSLVLPPLNFTHIKVWTSDPNGATDGDNSNDTLEMKSYFQTFAHLPFTENFDSTWIDKYAVRDVPSGYWLNTPATGNNSWRRDDDGASAGWGNLTTGAYTPAGALNTIHSARFHTSGNSVGGTVGILDLYLNFSSLAGTKELTFYHINTAGNDSVAVWISYDAGTTFSFLAKFTTGNPWNIRTVNLGTSIADHVILRFKCYSNQMGNTDPGIDEVKINLPMPEVSVAAIVKPVTACGLTSTESVKVRVKNNGSLAVQNIPIVYYADGNMVEETIADTLLPGDTLTYTFAATADLSTPGIHSVAAKVSYPGDYNPTNDSLATVINNLIQISSFPFVENFETAFTSYFDLKHNSNAIIGIENVIGNSGSYGLRMAGNVAGSWPQGSGTTTTAEQAWNTYTDHQSVALTCMIDATSLNNPELKLDLRQTYINGGGNKYSWFRVMINDTVQLPNNEGTLNFNPVTSNSDPFITQSYSLAAYANTNFKLSLQSSCKFNDANATGGLGDNVFIDNIVIREKPPYELALQEWVGPLSGCGLTDHETVSIQFKNLGSSPVDFIPVSYSIDNGTTWISEVCQTTVNPGISLVYTFATTANLSNMGNYICKAAVAFPGDADPSNDTVTYTINSVAYITINGFMRETYEFGSNGWTSGALSGNNDWDFGTPAKATINSAHSGINAWVTKLTQNYSDNSTCYLLSPCFNFSNLNDPHLSLWLWLRTETNYDGMIMEVSVNDSSWYKIAADASFYNNNSNQGPLTAPKWSGNNNGWTLYTTSLPGLANQPKVQIRFRFASDYMQTDEGVAVDDISIFDPFPDAAPVRLISPVSGCDLTNQEIVTAEFKNDGIVPFIGFSVLYKVDNGAEIVEVVSDTLQPGESISYTFATPADLTLPGMRNLTIGTQCTGDLNFFNDYIQKMVYNTASTDIPLFVDFDTEDIFDHLAFSTGSFSSFSIPNTGNPFNSAMLSGGAAGNWPDNSDTTTTSAEAWGYVNHLADIHTCTVSFPPPTGPVGLWFDLKQTFSQGNKYSWFRVLVNDTLPIPDIFGTVEFNPLTADADLFQNHMYVLTSYGPEAKITLQASCKYDEANSPVSTFDAALIDNFRIDIIESVPETDNISFTLYPNPVNDKINVALSYTLSGGVAEIINMNGQVVKTADCNGKQLISIDVKSLPAGVYAVKLQNGNYIKVQRFIKNS